jgi:hypothetical protein
MFCIHKLINCIWINEELPQQWKKSIIIPVYKVLMSLVVIEGYHCWQPHMNFYAIFLSRG